MLRVAEGQEMTQRKLKALYRLSSIDQRYTVIEDYSKESGYTFFPDVPDLSPAPGTASRMRKFEETALPLAAEAIKDALPEGFDYQEITHLIAVSCTGMYAPGIDIELIETLGLKTSVERTCINFMGCYAAFSAFKVANSICKANPKAKVVLVCIELCTLHFQNELDDDQMIASTIFGDGAAAMLVQGEPGSEKCLSMREFYCDLALGGKDAMTWKIRDTGYEMKLSSAVPNFLEEGVDDLVNRLLGSLDLGLGDIDHFALHPGGKRILQALEKSLKLNKEQTAASYHILRQYGNMSSASVIFVIDHLLRGAPTDKEGQLMLSMAFGPGLTLESGLFELHNC